MEIRPEETVDRPLAELDAAIAAYEAAMVPAGPARLSVAMDALMAFADAFRLPVGNLRSVAAIYRDTLAHLPADLLSLAVSRSVVTHRYGMRLPLPGEILAHVAEDWAARKTAALRLEILARKARRERRDEAPPAKPMTEAERQAAVAEATAALRGVKRVPAGDDREPRTSINPAALAELANLTVDPEAERKWLDLMRLNAAPSSGF